MSLKLDKNETKNGSGYMKQEETQGHKLFQNKAANRALIIAGIVIAVVIVTAIIFINVPIG